MHNCIYDGFTECRILKQWNLFSFYNPVRFICLKNVQHVSIPKDLIQRIQQTLISEFPHRI